MRLNLTVLAINLTITPLLDPRRLTLTPTRPTQTPSPTDPQTTLTNLYTKASTVRCPFFRRRLQDGVDASALLLRFLVARHRTLFPAWAMEMTLTPPGSMPLHRGATSQEKLVGLSSSDLAAYISMDWDNSYYITGHLSPQVYSDSCLFTSPDPDMPVRGLSKYVAASSHLFDPSCSVAEARDVSVDGEGNVRVEWTLEGRLMLPWRPEIPCIDGVTTYIRGEGGLVVEHREIWGKGVLEAFWLTLAPRNLKGIWGGEGG